MKNTSWLILALCPALVHAQAPVPTSPSQQQTTIALQQTSPGSAQPGYVLGPGDTVKVTVWTGNEYLEQNLIVAADGTLLIPFSVNKITPVSGLTATQLRDWIQKELQRYYLRPVVQVLTVGYESKKAYLVGEVQTPGQFPIFADTRILDFIIQHGGFGQRANLTEVQVTRAEGQKQRVNLYDIVLKGDRSQNIPVMPNDIIFVPSLETVGKKYFMLGELRNPGVLHSQEDLTLLDAISKAGTLSLAAQAKHVFVVRVNPGGSSEVMDIAFSDIYKKGDFSGNVVLKDGDIVYVPRSLRTRIADVMNSIIPVTSFIRDTALLNEIISGRNR